MSILFHLDLPFKMTSLKSLIYYSQRISTFPLYIFLVPGKEQTSHLYTTQGKEYYGNSISSSSSSSVLQLLWGTWGQKKQRSFSRQWLSGVLATHYPRSKISYQHKQHLRLKNPHSQQLIQLEVAVKYTCHSHTKQTFEQWFA